jgi:lysyl-tRNA synthetase class 2
LLASFDQPVFIYDYPLPQAALSKPCANKPGYAERFELYIGGIELANAFSELTDAKVQRERFESELALRKELGKTEYHLDEDFIAALEAGMPESGGVALGVDRLAMLLANVPSIQDVLYFPLETVFDLS